MEYRKTFYYNKNNKDNIALNNKILQNMKNSSSGINVNKYMNRTMNKNFIMKGNNLIKSNINKNIKNNNDLLNQKYIKNKIDQLFAANRNYDIIKNSKKNLSRNINNMNNIYKSQSIKFKTSEINKYNY